MNDYNFMSLGQAHTEIKLCKISSLYDSKRYTLTLNSELNSVYRYLKQEYTYKRIH